MVSRVDSIKARVDAKDGFFPRFRGLWDEENGEKHGDLMGI